MNALPVDITNITNQNDFLLLVEEMNRTHIPRALKRENKTVALLFPVGTTEYHHEKSAVEEALSLAGKWSDLPSDHMEEEFDRIRHQSKPTLPIELGL